MILSLNYIIVLILHKIIFNKVSAMGMHKISRGIYVLYFDMDGLNEDYYIAAAVFWTKIA